MSSPDCSQGHLALQHIDILRSRGIKPDVASTRGVRTITAQKELEALGFGPKQRSTPGLLIPICSTAGRRVSFVYRPDDPRIDDRGRPIKYESPPGSDPHIDVPPGIKDVLADAAMDLWVTEGPLKADAAVSAGLPCIALPGVWSFGRHKQLLHEWDDIALEGRLVYLAFDSDVATNGHVHRALSRLHDFLTRRTADVRVVQIPPTTDNQKQGLDDYLAGGGSPQALIESATMDVGLPPHDPSVVTVAPYVMDSTGIWMRGRKDDDPDTLLTNFPVGIVEDEIVDDGDRQDRRYKLVATVDGQVRHMTVPAGEFASLSWVPQFGAKAIIAPGAGRKDSARAAIQMLSDPLETRTYSHTGWREFDGQYLYLHAGGALGADGSVPEVRVDFGPPADRFSLPDPPIGERRKEVVRAALEVLAVAPDEVIVPLLAAVFRAPLGAARTAIHLYGQTGAGKTELAALAQQFYGAGMDARSLPAHWQSTENFLEDLTFRLKDVVLVVDEYAPSADLIGNRAMQRTAERMFRAVGNGSGRGRMRTDTSLRSPRPPRGFLISTGEDRPGGHSLAARRVDIPVPLDAVDWDRLAQVQELARNGVLAEAMAAYICWLAPKARDLLSISRNRASELRRDATATGQHRRNADGIADLAVGYDQLLEFGAEIGAITQEEREAYWTAAWATLKGIADQQADVQLDNDPVAIFLDILRSSFGTGTARLMGPHRNAPPEDEKLWGWTGDLNGTPIGWVDGGDAYLEPGAVYQHVVEQARATGQSFPVSRRELARRLKERVLLASTDTQRKRTTIRKMLGGARRDVWHLHRSTIFPDDESQSSQPAHDESEERSGAALAGRNDGPVSAMDDDDRPANRATTRPLSKGQRPAPGQMGPSGQLGRTIHEVGEVRQVTTPVCMNRDHLIVWTGRDGQDICTACHPPVARAS